MNAWLICPKPMPEAGLRLFCFPHSGGSAQIFSLWANGLPAGIEVCAVQLPGRGTRVGEAPFTRLAPLVTALAGALIPYLDKPFALFGHSMGALVAFELARELRRNFQPAPVHMFVSGHSAPHIARRAPALHNLPQAEFVRELGRLNGTPQQVLENAELMQLLLPALRADFEVCETYEYKPDRPLASPISAFGGLRDEEVTHSDLNAWSEHTSASFSVRMFRGDHFYLNAERAMLLRALARELLTYEAGMQAHHADQPVAERAAVAGASA
jgi:medium-chain acyl-[acyl-carrier-protein] hydrolase